MPDCVLNYLKTSTQSEAVGWKWNFGEERRKNIVPTLSPGKISNKVIVFATLEASPYYNKFYELRLHFYCFGHININKVKAFLWVTPLMYVFQLREILFMGDTSTVPFFGLFKYLTMFTYFISGKMKYTGCPNLKLLYSLIRFLENEKLDFLYTYMMNRYLIHTSIIPIPTENRHKLQNFKWTFYILLHFWSSRWILIKLKLLVFEKKRLYKKRADCWAIIK